MNVHLYIRVEVDDCPFAWLEHALCDAVVGVVAAVEKKKKKRMKK